MKRGEYKYENGNKIELVAYDPTIGGVRAAVIKGGIIRFEGTTFQCLGFLANEGDKKAVAHKKQFMAAISLMNGQTTTRALYERPSSN